MFLSNTKMMPLRIFPLFNNNLRASQRVNQRANLIHQNHLSPAIASQRTRSQEDKTCIKDSCTLRGSTDNKWLKPEESKKPALTSRDSTLTSTDSWEITITTENGRMLTREFSRRTLSRETTTQWTNLLKMFLKILRLKASPRTESQIENSLSLRIKLRN